MLVRLLVSSCLLILVVLSALINSSKGQTFDDLKLQKQEPPDYDDDLNDPKSLGNNGEGSGLGGGEASLDEYADDEEEEELLKLASKIPSTTSTTSKTTTTTTTTSTTTTTTTITIRTITTTRKSTTKPTTTTRTTILLTPWTKPTFNHESRIGKNRSITTTLATFNDLDASEFKDDQEEYPDELEDDPDYNEFLQTTKVSTTTFSTTRYSIPITTTRHSSPANHTASIWVLFKFLTRPPIAAGILAGLAIGIFTSVLLLVCIIQRYHKRDKSHSSYSTGLLYPNQYGYSKSPQEFYA
ncbi:unnamed protein product [Rotaria socialis]|uniref:Syndecan n=2 Tax=Rotaria TaxID=231623 RepID=A0A818KDF6_9BILA|nr:unnamed protein product [Rotaria socialis]CAF4622508.1 unnamed protein product [Rotaria socialis]